MRRVRLYGLVLSGAFLVYLVLRAVLPEEVMSWVFPAGFLFGVGFALWRFLRLYRAYKADRAVQR